MKPRIRVHYRPKGERRWAVSGLRISESGDAAPFHTQWYREPYEAVEQALEVWLS
jgi:hypothetical protein